jgi:hypothetical protein
MRVDVLPGQSLGRTGQPRLDDDLREVLAAKPLSRTRHDAGSRDDRSLVSGSASAIRRTSLQSAMRSR